MAKKSTKSDGQKKAEKVYKKAKKTAKKHGKLRQFNVAVAILLVLALIAGLVYYFVFYEPVEDKTQENLSGSFTFDTYVEENLNNFSIIENRGDLEVHYINVGQADCILILLPDGRNMLIDAGGTGDYRTHLKEYLQKQGIKTIDYALLTHTDADHVESFDYVLDWCEVKNIFIPQLYPSYKAGTSDNRYTDITADRKVGVISTREYYDFFTRADDETYVENGAKYSAKVYANAGFMNISGTGYEIDIYCMPASVYNKDFEEGNDALNKNEVSPSVLITYQGKQFLFTGDATGSSHENFMAMYKERNPNTDLDVDVYKVAHHGSAKEESNNKKFINEIESEYAVISVGDGNKYGHPHKEAVDNITAYSQFKKLYRTDKYGDVVFGVRDNKLYTPEQMAA